LGVFIVIALALHLGSIVLVWWRLRRAAPVFGVDKLPGVTVLRPICGVENNLAETLETTFTTAYPNCEILFCAASPTDPAIAVAQTVIGRHPEVSARVLTGDDKVSGNPKLNNLVKGWAAARHDLIMMADSNVLLPADYIQTLLAHLTPDTGLVTSPPAGIRPDGFWASLEAAFLNTYQDRWQLLADQFGHGYAQGKILFWRRDVLEAAGGIAVLGREMAEDVASTKTVRAAGLKVRVVQTPFPQPLGTRTWPEVWGRQLRWSRVRRLGFPALFWPEVISGGLFPVLGGLLMAATGVWPIWVALALPVLWYGVEWALARAATWPASVRDVAAFVLRDALIPALWIGAWMGSGFEWRGNAMRADDIPNQGQPGA